MITVTTTFLFKLNSSCGLTNRFFSRTHTLILKNMYKLRPIFFNESQSAYISLYNLYQLVKEKDPDCLTRVVVTIMSQNEDKKTKKSEILKPHLKSSKLDFVTLILCSLAMLYKLRCSLRRVLHCRKLSLCLFVSC